MRPRFHQSFIRWSSHGHVAARHCATVHAIPLSLRARRPLRISVVTETWPPEVNGVARAVKLMVDGLLQRDYKVDLIRPRQATDGAPLPDTAVTAGDRRLSVTLTQAVSIPGYSTLQLGAAWPQTLMRHWHADPPDLVHVVTEGPLGWAAVIAARRLGIPVCSDFHTNFHTYSRDYGVAWLARPVAAFLRVLHNRCDCTLVPTGEMRRDLAALDFDRLAIVGRGLDTRLFSPEKRNEELRRSWGCQPDDLVALCVSRIAAEKNLDLFVRTVRSMRTLDARLKPVLVGDGPVLGALRERFPDLHCAGMRTGEDLATHYASADIFVFPSLSETFGNVTVEAMASGLAVLAYDYAAAHEYIVDGVTGVLAPYGDAEVFINKARWMTQSRACLPKMRRRARTQAERLSVEVMFDDLEQVLLAVADRAPVLPMGTAILASRS